MKVMSWRSPCARNPPPPVSMRLCHVRACVRMRVHVCMRTPHSFGGRAAVYVSVSRLTSAMNQQSHPSPEAAQRRSASRYTYTKDTKWGRNAELASVNVSKQYNSLKL
jgi:hypothetical protein